MADNVPITAGTGTSIATDDIGGVHYPRGKVVFGADGAATDVSAAAPLPVTQQASTAAVTSVSASASSVSLLASNTARRGGYFFNDSSAVLYLKCGTTASTTSYTAQVGPGGYYELPAPVYTGAVDGIWSAAAGSARITEVT